MAFPHYKQLDAMDCGPTCLRMIAKHYGKHFSLEHLRQLSYIDREGVSLLGISEAAEKVGFRTRAYRLSFKALKKELVLPAIVHWNQNHFVVVYKITNNKVFVADPASGKITYTHKEFLKHWGQSQKNDEHVGIALELEPSPLFYDQEEDKQKRGFGFLFRYVFKYKKLVTQLVLGLLLGSLLMLIMPFLHKRWLILV